MKNCNSLGVSIFFAVQKFESVVKYVGFYRWRRESVVKYVGPYRRRRESVVKYVGPYRRRLESCCQAYSSHISKKFKPWKKWLLQLKLLCGIAFFWPWAARGLSGSQRPFWEPFCRDSKVLRVVHFLEKTSVLLERGRKNAASEEHGRSIH